MGTLWSRTSRSGTTRHITALSSKGGGTAGIDLRLALDELLVTELPAPTISIYISFARSLTSSSK